jgi:glycosyltransferase involved in cell wall biosynthesis
MDSSSSIDTPKVSIGIPVYNGEEFLRKRFDSILEQTFTDYEVIISDNASTDSTSEICKEYVKSDNRFRYVRQQNNIGGMLNFYFVLQEAKCKYFVWAAADDYWHPQFLEKNIRVLDSDDKIVGSIGKFTLYGNYEDPFEREKRLLAKIGLGYRPHGTLSIVGPYEKRVRTYLKKFPYQLSYGVFRTEKLRQSVVDKRFATEFFALVLNLLKYGEIHQVDEILFYVSPGGISSKGMIYLARFVNESFLGLIFPHYPLTRYCAKQLGTRLFLKNLDCFIRLNLDAHFLLLLDIIRWFKKKF